MNNEFFLIHTMSLKRKFSSLNEETECPTINIKEDFLIDSKFYTVWKIVKKDTENKEVFYAKKKDDSSDNPNLKRFTNFRKYIPPLFTYTYKNVKWKANIFYTKEEIEEKERERKKRCITKGIKDGKCNCLDTITDKYDVPGTYYLSDTNYVKDFANDCDCEDCSFYGCCLLYTSPSPRD